MISEQNQDDVPTQLSGLSPVQKFIAWVGIPGIIALGLVYQLTVTFASVPQDAKLARETAAANARRLDRLERYMLRICLNTAPDEAARQGCWASTGEQ